MKDKRKEFLLKAHKDASNDYKKRIEAEWPKLFKSEGLEVGKWYHRGGELLVWNGGKLTYGWSSDGGWSDNLVFINYITPTPATDSEVEAALIAEAKKRGFEEGVAFDGLHITFTTSCKGLRLDSSGRLMTATNCVVFDSGQWATIVETITKADAEKELGKQIID